MKGELAIGFIYGRLELIKFIERKNRDDFYLCRCECGNEKIIRLNSLKSGNTVSCGCFHKQQASESNKTHGLTKTKTYRTWYSMKQRCFNINDTRYSDYGGRGITVCDRWKESFENFLEDMGKCPSRQHSIDRIDNDKGYYPENCRWATLKEQSRNKRVNRLIEYKGKTQCLTAWAEELNIKRETLSRRLNQLKWSVEKAFTTPIRTIK